MATSVNAAGEVVPTGGIKFSPKASGTVLTNVHSAFGRVVDKRAVDIDTSEWINICRAAVPLYDLIFPTGGVVSNILKKDIETHIKEVEDVYVRDPTTHGRLVSAIEAEVKALGRDAKKVRAGDSATHGTLWLVRTLDFISRFMNDLADPTLASKSPTELARDSYNAVLKPYHGWVVANVVKMAFSVVPDRRQLIIAFGFSDEAQAREELRATVRVMRPVVDNMAVWLKQNGLDFGDKSGL